jgi:hypothetical protein
MVEALGSRKASGRRLVLVAEPGRRPGWAATAVRSSAGRQEPRGLGGDQATSGGAAVRAGPGRIERQRPRSTFEGRRFLRTVHGTLGSARPVRRQGAPTGRMVPGPDVGEPRDWGELGARGRPRDDGPGAESASGRQRWTWPGGGRRSARAGPECRVAAPWRPAMAVRRTRAISTPGARVPAAGS